MVFSTRKAVDRPNWFDHKTYLFPMFANELHRFDVLFTATRALNILIAAHRLVLLLLHRFIGASNVPKYIKFDDTS